MRVVVNEFMSLDGVVQAPGGPEEDTDGGFAHGGWSVPYFDPEVMGAAIGEGMTTADALLFGRRTWQGMAAAWPGRAGDPYADQMNAIKKYVRVTHADGGRPDVEQHDVAVARRCCRRHRRAARPGRRRHRDLGQRQSGGDPARRRFGRRAQLDDRADPARRRQAHLPRRTARHDRCSSSNASRRAPACRSARTTRRRELRLGRSYSPVSPSTDSRRRSA